MPISKGGQMKRNTRGKIKKLLKLSRLKDYAHIRDRLLAVVGLKKKLPVYQISQQLNRSRDFVSTWGDRYRRLGIKGLFDMPRSGRPTKLFQDQEKQLKQRIEIGPLVNDQVANFDALSIKELIQKDYGAYFSTSGVYSLLHRIGFAWISTRPQHEKNNPAAMLQWKEETLPDAFKNACETHPDVPVEIWFQDEMRFGEKTSVTRRWSLKASAPRQFKQLGFRNTHVYGAVNPVSGEKVGLVNPGCNTEAMNIHLDLIAQRIGADRHALLILDQAGWHEISKKLIIPKNITLLSLPPYSPELNPVERLWRWIKRKYLANRIIKKEEDLELLGCELWNKITDQVVKSICKVGFLPVGNF
jgi:transposase